MMDDGPPLVRPLMMPGEQPPPQQQPATGTTGGATSSGGGYSVPGVLHFVKNEFVRFEKERANWEVERSELQAKISFLQGERKGHDNLMRDLVRRIKMLEYALKQERLKLMKINQPGKEVGLSDLVKPPQFEQDVENTTAPSLCNQQESRKILREYLREVGFPENVLEARVARINLYRSLTNSTTTNKDKESPLDHHHTTTTTNTTNTSAAPITDKPVDSSIVPNGTDTDIKETDKDDSSSNPNVDAMLDDDFGFLNNEDDSDDEDDEGEWVGAGEANTGDNSWPPTTGATQSDETKNLLKSLESGNLMEDPADVGTESAMDEWGSSFNHETKSDESPKDGDGGWSGDFTRQVNMYKDRKRKNTTKLSNRPSRSELELLKNQTNEISNSVPSDLGMGIMRMPGKQHDGEGGRSPTSSRRVPHENIEVSLGIDDLAGLSISNEASTSYETQSTESLRKWEHKFTLRSHFDVVTDVCFHPYESLLVTASEDFTLKLWSIQKSTTTHRRSAIIDLEPLYTFRGHTSPILSTAFSNDGDVIYSGGFDGSIRMWQVPADLNDPFDVYDAEIQRGCLDGGHTDCVWGIVVHPTLGVLVTCSSDGSSCLWDPLQSTSKLKEFKPTEDIGVPTSVDFVRNGVNHVVVSYDTARTLVFDTETGQNVLSLDSSVTYDGTKRTQINKVVSHPTLPLIVTAHEDKYIRFFDSKSGTVIHSMTAHMDAVTGLAIDPHGLYLLSGSHDGSLRYWSMESKMCVQDITAHRKRFDESIYNVACHNTKPYFASAGADGIAKVFT